MKKIVEYVSVIIAIIVAAIFYINFDMEGILWDRQSQKAVSQAEIEADRDKDYSGKPAGEGIIEVKDRATWEGVSNDLDYVTVKPKSVEKTNVYSLAKWADHYYRKKNGTTGRKRAETQTEIIDYSANYSPYYIIELEDGTKILAQMNRGIAKKIAKHPGEVALPLGQKLAYSQAAKNALADICAKQKVSTDYVLYTIDNTWEKEKENVIFFGKAGATAAVCLILGVVFLVIVDIIFGKSREQD